jgi:hypothetical protein
VSALYIFLLANGHYFALPNPDAYEVAKAAASYKERGLSHDQAFSEVRDAIRDAVLPFSILRDAAKTDSSLRRTYGSARKLRLLIRKSPLNRLLSSE